MNRPFLKASSLETYGVARVSDTVVRNVGTGSRGVRCLSAQNGRGDCEDKYPGVHELYAVQVSAVLDEAM